LFWYGQHLEQANNKTKQNNGLTLMLNAEQLHALNKLS